MHLPTMVNKSLTTIGRPAIFVAVCGKRTRSAPAWPRRRIAADGFCFRGLRVPRLPSAEDFITYALASPMDELESCRPRQGGAASAMTDQPAGPEKPLARAADAAPLARAADAARTPRHPHPSPRAFPCLCHTRP